MRPERSVSVLLSQTIGLLETPEIALNSAVHRRRRAKKSQKPTVKIDR